MEFSGNREKAINLARDESVDAKEEELLKNKLCLKEKVEEEKTMFSIQDAPHNNKLLIGKQSIEDNNKPKENLSKKIIDDLVSSPFSSNESLASVSPSSTTGGVGIKRKRRLSHVDKLTLLTEIPTNKSICCAYICLERPVSHEDLIEILRTRVVNHYIRFRSIVSFDYSSFDELDPNQVDIEKHVRYLRVEKNLNYEYTLEEEEELLKSLLSKISFDPLDFNRPLWEMIVVDNCEKLGYVLFLKIHHAIGDGASLAMFFSQFCDQGEEHFKEQIGELVNKKVSASVLNSIKDYAIYKWIVSLLTVLWLVFGFIAVACKWTAEVLRGPDNNIFKSHELSEDKKITWSKNFSVKDVRMVGQKFYKATINDVILNSLAGALMRYNEKYDPKSTNKRLRLSIPVNLRRSVEEFNQLANEFGFMITPLQLTTRDPVKRLKTVKQTMDYNKKIPEPIFAYQFSKLAYILPIFALRLYFNFLAARISAVFTNIFGSNDLMTLNSIPVKNLVVFTPCPSDIAIGFAVLVYNEGIKLSVTADTKVVPSPEELIEYFEYDLEQIISIASSESLH
ncbi:hypothetical protein ABK040_013282 [Willaertia magna]